MANNNHDHNPVKVVTGPNTRWSYLSVWDARSINGSAPRYSISLIIPKSDFQTINKVKQAIEAAYRDGLGKLRGTGKTVPPLAAVKSPLRDGDVERPEDPAYENAYFLNANSSKRPEIVDAGLNPIYDHSEVYSGVYGKASISFFAFNNNGVKGIACGLNNLQKLRDGEHLDGYTSAVDDFGPGSDDDFLN